MFANQTVPHQIFLELVMLLLYEQKLSPTWDQSKNVIKII